MDETKKLIDDRIRILEQGIEGLKPGTDEYQAMQSAIAEMIKTRAQIDKDDATLAATAEEAKKDRAVRIGTSIFSVITPLAVYSALWKQGLRFEKEGYVSSASVKNLFQRFKFF